MTYKRDVLKWGKKVTSKMGIQEGCPKVMYRSDAKKWCLKLTSKSVIQTKDKKNNVQKWHSKGTAKSGVKK